MGMVKITIIFGMIASLLVAIPLVSAGSVLDNGSFSDDLMEWNDMGELLVDWISQGFSGEIATGEQIVSGRGGAVKLSVPPKKATVKDTVYSDNRTVSGYIYQDFNISRDEVVVNLSFAYQKAVELGEEAAAKIRILPPGGRRPVTVWQDAGDILTVSGTVYGDEWNKVENLDISNVFTGKGRYQIQLYASMSGANTYVAYDEVHLSVSVPDREPPSKPQGLTALDLGTGESVRLSWEANSEQDLNKYNVYRAVYGDTGFNKIASVFENVYLDTGLSTGAEYRYYVTALDKAGNESAPSDIVTVIPTKDEVPPASPVGLKVTDLRTGGKLLLSWTPNTENDLNGYRLYRAPTPDGPFVEVVELAGDVTKFTDETVENDTIYYYYLIAVDIAGNSSEPSPVVSGMPTLDTTPPGVPRGLTVDNPGIGTELLIRWLPNGDADLAGYHLYRAESGTDNFQLVATIAGTADKAQTQYLDTGLTRNTAYRYRLTAFDDLGNESKPAEAQGISQDKTPPAVPTGLSVDDPWSGDELVLSWQRNTEEDLAGYNLYRSGTGAADDFEKVNDKLIKDTMYADDGLKQGKTYHYYLTAVDTSGNESQPSELASGKPYRGAAVKVTHPTAGVPDRLRIELSSSALFVDSKNKTIRIKTVAEDVYGNPVPVSGTWRYATDFSEFTKLEAVSPTTVVGEFTSNSPGKAEIIVEFTPDQLGAVSVRATTWVRALDWDVELKGLKRRVATGEEVRFRAVITDHNGQPVTAPEARVVFAVEHSKKVPGAWKRKPKVGYFQADGRVQVVDVQGIPLGIPRPDRTGSVYGKLAASTVPGINLVTAVLQYRDLRVPSAPLQQVDVSRTWKVEVEPGKPSYVGWDPEKITIKPARIYRATINAYDAFGNVTRDGTNNLEVSIKSPQGGHVDFSLDQGKTWIHNDEWYPVPLGTQVKFRLLQNPGQSWQSDYGYLLVRIDQGGSGLTPPPGINQVNRPLYIQLVK